MGNRPNGFAIMVDGTVKCYHPDSSNEPNFEDQMEVDQISNWTFGFWVDDYLSKIHVKSPRLEISTDNINREEVLSLLNKYLSNSILEYEIKVDSPYEGVVETCFKTQYWDFKYMISYDEE